MRRLHLQCLEKFPCAYITIVAHGALQARSIVGWHLLFNAGENFLAALSQLVEVIHEIDEEEFRAEAARERRLDAKVELAAAQRELAVPLVIIDYGLVVELGRTDTERVVGVGRGQEKS